MPSASVFFVLEKLESDPNYGFRLLLKPDDTNLTIDDVKQNSPAGRCGLKAGMFLIAVNGVSTKGKSLPEVTGLIKASTGNRLTFECLPGEHDDIYANVDESADSSESDDLQLEEQVSSRSASIKSTESEIIHAPAVTILEPGMTAVSEDQISVQSSKTASDTSSLKRRDSIAPKVTPVFTTENQTPTPRTFQPFNVEDQPHPVVFHHLRKWPVTKEFGFAIARHNHGPLTLSRVEENRPAYCSSLRDGMILCQVNSSAVTHSTTLTEAAEWIKESGDEVSILVITQQTQAWLERCGVELEDVLSELRRETYDPPPEIPNAPLPED